jgi:hypothetical protein
MRTKHLVLSMLAAAALLAPLPSYAQEPYPWCAVYSGSRDGGGGATNCGFVTFQQCLDTVRGIGGFCERNPMYPGRETTGQKPRQSRKPPRY